MHLIIALHVAVVRFLLQKYNKNIPLVILFLQDENRKILPEENLWLQVLRARFPHSLYYQESQFFQEF